MGPLSPVPAARPVSSRMRSFSPAVNVRRLGRSDNSGLAAAGAGTTVGLRPSSVPAPAAAFVSATLLGMTTRQFSYALKSKLPGRLCLIIIGTEGGVKLSGPGEWLVEKHGTKRRRAWRKLHLAVDARTGTIVASTLTSKEVDDAAELGPLLVDDPLAVVVADGAYDQDT